jgi:hypothetical protein
LVAAATSTVAFGQFVTPPPASNPDPNKDIPKAPPPPPAPVQQPSQEAPSLPPPKVAKAQKEPIPNVPFKEWEKDAKGNIIPLTEPLELAALRRNPLVTTDAMAKIDAYYPERHKAMERIVIENLDLVERMDAGLFERTKFSDKEQVRVVVETTKPLTTMSLATELKNRQIIDDKAFGVNSRITTAYTKAQLPPKDPKATGDAKKGGDLDSLGAIYKQGYVEHLWTYNELLVKAAGEAGVKGDMPKEAKIKAVKEALAKMSVDQRKDLLRKVSGYTKPEVAKPDAAKPADIKEPAPK